MLQIVRNHGDWLRPSFAKIPRHDARVVLTEKVDGTHAVIDIEDQGIAMLVAAGGRNRWLTPEDDNHGFAAWVEANADALVDTLGCGVHHGEWYGSRINRGYGLAEKRFMRFRRPTGVEGQPEHGLWEHPTVLYDGPHPVDIDALVRELLADGSQHVPGYLKPEGAVVYWPTGGMRTKVVIDKPDAPEGTKLYGNFRSGASVPPETAVGA